MSFTQFPRLLSAFVAVCFSCVGFSALAQALTDEYWMSMGAPWSDSPGQQTASGALTVDRFGNTYIGGGFSKVGGIAVNGVARWDGRAWSSLGAAVQGTYRSLIWDSQDHLWAIGDFALPGQPQVAGAALWDGTAWKDVGSGLSLSLPGVLFNNVSAVAFDNAGGIWVAVRVLLESGEWSTSIARRNGSSWAHLKGRVSGAVFAMAFVGDVLHIAGSFGSAGGVAVNNIARWDGQTWSGLGTGLDREASAVVAIGQNLFAGGVFQNAGGVEVSGVARWNGQTWSAMGAGPPSISESGVRALAVVGQTLFAGAQFGEFGQIPKWGVAHWDGAAWGMLPDPINETYDLKVAGGILHATGLGRYPASFWDGTEWRALGTGFDRPIRAVVSSANAFYAAGEFTSVGGVNTRQVAKWDGQNWSGVGGKLLPVALAVDGDTLFAGGDGLEEFQARSLVGRLDPTGWTYFDKELGGVVQTLAVLNGTVFVGGFGFTASGLNSSCIAQWDGTTWKPVGEGLQEDVSALVNVMTVNAGELYVGGSFTSAGNLKVNNICKWDGVRWSALGEGISGNSVVGAPQVKALHFADGTLYVGGEFGRAGFRNTAGIAMWRNGQWSELGSGVGWTGNFPPRRQYVTAITSYDGAIYVGGWFNRAGGATANQVARWDGISWSGIGSGLERIEPGVNSMAIFGSDLFVAGNLTRIGGKDSAYLAKALLGVTAVSLQVLPDGRIASLFRGMPGKQYHLQRATRLDSLVDWETVTAVPLTAGGDGTLSFVDPTPLAISAFYRAQRP